MSVITPGELRHGAEKSQARARALAAWKALQGLIAVEPLTPPVAVHCSKVRSTLERAGKPIGNKDLWIAAHALAEGGVPCQRAPRLCIAEDEHDYQRAGQHEASLPDAVDAIPGGPGIEFEAPRLQARLRAADQG